MATDPPDNGAALRQIRIGFIDGQWSGITDSAIIRQIKKENLLNSLCSIIHKPSFETHNTLDNAKLLNGCAGFEEHFLSKEASNDTMYQTTYQTLNELKIQTESRPRICLFKIEFLIESLISN